MKRVFVTGGHMTPALAVMEVLKRRGWEIVYIGRIHAVEGDRALSQEYRVVSNAGYRFLSIITGRIQRTLTRFWLLSILKIPIGFVQACLYIAMFRPQVILSFGGYIGIPVAFMGWVFQIPIVIHEQTRAPGLANRLIAKIATKVCVAWKDVEAHFSKDKVFFTSNPIRKEILTVNESLAIDNDRPLLYITGGNLGAHSLNIVVEEILEKLLHKYTIIHQCGNSFVYKDLERLQKHRQEFSDRLKKRYLAMAYIDAKTIGWVMKQAAVIVSRAGANIVFEVMLLGKPALFIPLPWSGRAEQEKNASFLANAGAATVLLQKDLTAETLYTAIEITFANRHQIQKQLKEYKKFTAPNAAERVADVVESVCEKKVGISATFGN